MFGLTHFDLLGAENTSFGDLVQIFAAAATGAAVVAGLILWLVIPRMQLFTERVAKAEIDEGIAQDVQALRAELGEFRKEAQARHEENLRASGEAARHRADTDRRLDELEKTVRRHGGDIAEIRGQLRAN